jgi:Mg2+/Co2+ transporter CorC
VSLFEQEDDTATIGGVITGELGRIPENGELLMLPGLNVLVLDADDTRVLSLEIEMADTSEEIISEETE